MRPPDNSIRVGDMHRRGLRSACVILLALMVQLPRTSAAETFQPFLLDPDLPDTIILDGPIDSRAALMFRRALEASPTASTVLLNSPGGLVDVSLLIAEEIDERRMNTSIPEGFVCASACAIVFMAGSGRSAEGKLGVHQISAPDPNLMTAQLTLSDILEVLEKYESPQHFLIKMLRTPPSEMYFFTDEEISNGISRSRNNDIVSDNLNWKEILSARLSSIGIVSDWNLFLADVDGKEICFAWTQAKEHVPTNMDHGDILFLVRFLPAHFRKFDALFLSSYQLAGNVIVEVNDAKFELESEGRMSSPRNADEAEQLVASLASGQTMRVSATSMRGNVSSYVFNIGGFSSTLPQIRACH